MPIDQPIDQNEHADAPTGELPLPNRLSPPADKVRTIADDWEELEDLGDDFDDDFDDDFEEELEDELMDEGIDTLADVQLECDAQLAALLADDVLPDDDLV